MNSLPILMAASMEKKLAENSHKTGWDDLDLRHLSMRITQEKKELIRAIQQRKTPKEVWGEAADIANFAAMLAANYEAAYGTDYLDLPEEWESVARDTVGRPE